MDKDQIMDKDEIVYYKHSVALLTTGGTIAGRGDEGETMHYHPGKYSPRELLASVSGVEELAHIDVEPICNINSDDIQFSHWIAMARRIEQLSASGEYDGFVITHGTDTLEETAWFLELTLRIPQPVVLTGSMRPASARGADGEANLYQAVAVARDPASRGRGVLTVFGDRIYRARNLRKVDALSPEAFSTGDNGCLGYVKDDWVAYDQAYPVCRSARRYFSPELLETLPPVEIIYFAMDSNPALITAAAQVSRGLVIAGAGCGEYSREFLEALDALPADFPVIRASRIPGGWVPPHPHYDRPNVIPAGDLSPVQARILLRLALAVELDVEMIRDIFRDK